MKLLKIFKRSNQFIESFEQERMEPCLSHSSRHSLLHLHKHPQIFGKQGKSNLIHFVTNSAQVEFEQMPVSAGSDVTHIVTSIGITELRQSRSDQNVSYKTEIHNCVCELDTSLGLQAVRGTVPELDPFSLSGSSPIPPPPLSKSSCLPCNSEAQEL